MAAKTREAKGVVALWSGYILILYPFRLFQVLIWAYHRCRLHEIPGLEMGKVIHHCRVLHQGL